MQDWSICKSFQLTAKLTNYRRGGGSDASLPQSAEIYTPRLPKTSVASNPFTLRDVKKTSAIRVGDVKTRRSNRIGAGSPDRLYEMK